MVLIRVRSAMMAFKLKGVPAFNKVPDSVALIASANSPESLGKEISLTRYSGPVNTS